MLLEEESVRVVRGPRENGYRPAIDPLFRTAARVFSSRVIGVILSGVLDDGTLGLGVVKEHGGRTLVQHPEDALYSGMPESAIELVNPDVVLPAAELGAAIVEYTHEEAPVGVPHNPGPPQDQLLEESFERVDRGASDSPQPGASSGFGALVSAGEDLRDLGGELVLVADSPSMIKLLTIAGVGRLFRIETSLFTAVDVVVGGSR